MSGASGLQTRSLRRGARGTRFHTRSQSIRITLSFPSLPLAPVLSGISNRRFHLIPRAHRMGGHLQTLLSTQQRGAEHPRVLLPWRRLTEDGANTPVEQR